eukprot:22810-Chlamydomonas_euryale.AAC.1
MARSSSSTSSLFGRPPSECSSAAAAPAPRGPVTRIAVEAASNAPGSCAAAAQARGCGAEAECVTAACAAAVASAAAAAGSASEMPCSGNSSASAAPAPASATPLPRARRWPRLQAASSASRACSVAPSRQLEPGCHASSAAIARRSRYSIRGCCGHCRCAAPSATVAHVAAHGGPNATPTPAVPPAAAAPPRRAPPRPSLPANTRATATR